MVVYSDGSACEEQDADLCVVGWALVANGGARQPVSASGTLLFVSMMWTGQSFSSSSCSFESHELWRSTSRTAVSWSKALTTRAWADLWHDVWREIDAWSGLGGDLSVHKVKEHTTPDAVRACIISALNPGWQ